MSQPTPAQGWSELLLALPEFLLTDAYIVEHDELVAEVVLPRDVQPCTRCGTIQQHPIHDWRTHTVRHLPVAGRATRLVWHKRLLACVEGCGTFVERTASIAPGAVWSRAAARAAVALSEANVAIETIRRQFGVGWNTVMRAVLAAAEQLTAVSPRRVGIDETVMVTGRLTTRRRAFLTALVCLDTSLVVAVTEGRDRASAVRLLADHAPDAEVVACDLFSGFKSAADTLEGAVVVADVFHLIRLALQVLDEAADADSSRSTATADTRTTHCSASAGSYASARNASESTPSSGSSSGYGRPTPTTKSPPPGSRSTCSARCTPPPTGTPPTGAWSPSTSGPPPSTCPRSPGSPRRSTPGRTRCSRSSTPAPPTPPPSPPTSRSSPSGEDWLMARGFRNTGNYRARILLHAGQPRRVPTTTRIRSYSFTTAA
jgi:hypothetical protein